jgi:CheY-like chemotaxis protein
MCSAYSVNNEDISMDFLSDQPYLSGDSAEVYMMDKYPGDEYLPLQYQPTIIFPSPFILVVDDDRLIGELLAELLKEAGFRVSVVSNGNEAFEIAQLEGPDLILSDIMMPECNGEMLANRLRANPNTQDIPMTLMSSTRPRLPHLSNIPFLPKPFDIDDVIDFVWRYVRVKHYPHGEG